jgi:hypothetical protein
VDALIARLSQHEREDGGESAGSKVGRMLVLPWSQTEFEERNASEEVEKRRRKIVV